jgi:hypothetical protein
LRERKRERERERERELQQQHHISFVVLQFFAAGSRKYATNQTHTEMKKKKKVQQKKNAKKGGNVGSCQLLLDKMNVGKMNLKPFKSPMMKSTKHKARNTMHLPTCSNGPPHAIEDDDATRDAIPPPSLACTAAVAVPSSSMAAGSSCYCFSSLVLLLLGPLPQLCQEEKKERTRTRTRTRSGFNHT